MDGSRWIWMEATWGTEVQSEDPVTGMGLEMDMVGRFLIMDSAMVSAMGDHTEHHHTMDWTTVSHATVMAWVGRDQEAA